MTEQREDVVPNRAVADLERSAEALTGLVYRRLYPDHTPPRRGVADLDELRRAFPSV
jgi:hypothetical protein